MKFLVRCEIILISINLFVFLYVNLKMLRNGRRNRKKYEEELENRDGEKWFRDEFWKLLSSEEKD